MKIPYALRNHSDQLVLVGVGAFLSGTVAGYMYAKRRYTMFVSQAAELAQDAAALADQMALDFDQVVAEAVVTPRNDPRDIVVVEQDDDPEEDAVVRVVRVFGADTDIWDYDAELAARTPELPYVIHVDEFMSNETGYKQDTVTYYVGDDVATDSHDTPIYNHNAQLGNLMFGHGSNDPNVVYVRNESLKLEWEVLKHTGSYEHEILGQFYEEETERELRHSIPRYRPE